MQTTEDYKKAYADGRLDSHVEFVRILEAYISVEEENLTTKGLKDFQTPKLTTLKELRDHFDKLISLELNEND